MTESTRYTALFPASAIPALAAFQGSGPFSAPDPQADWSGARVGPHPDDPDMVRLVATDSHNLLVLNVAGSCRPGPFGFSIPDELVVLCTPPPPFEMWAEGSVIPVPPPEWQVPGQVMLMGARSADTRLDDALLARVSAREPYPGNEDLGLGACRPHFVDRLLGLDFDGLAAAGGERASEEISPAALLRLAVLAKAFAPVAEDSPVIRPELHFAPGRQIWQFGASWAVTMAPEPDGPEKARD